MIYLFDIEKVSSESVKRLKSALPYSQREKIAKKAKISQKMSIIEYFLLKNILNLKDYPIFEYNKNGKPLLDGKNFSISHCENMLVISTAATPCGVDIQKVFCYDSRMAEYISTKSELLEINYSKNRDIALTKLFVKKEATIKCLGENLSKIKDISSYNLNYKFYKYKDFIICEATK